MNNFADSIGDLANCANFDWPHAFAIVGIIFGIGFVFWAVTR